MVRHLGKIVLGFLRSVALLLNVVISIFPQSFSLLKQRPRAVITVLLRQVYFTGFSALPIVGILALFIGIVIIAQIIKIAGHGSEGLTGSTLVWVVVRGVGPLITAIIVIARSGTAVSTELGLMQVHGEIDQLRIMGIDPERYLVLPRLLGMSISAVILTLIFELIALLGGILVASMVWGIPFGVYGMGVISSLTLKDLSVSIIKGSLFGILVAATCCTEGAKVGKRMTAVPQAATRAVMQSFYLVFILDGLISVVLF